MELRQTFRRWGGKRRTERMLHAAVWAGAVAGALATIVVGVWTPANPWTVWMASWLGGAIVAAGVMRCQRVDTVAAAREVDRQFGLADQCTTAAERLAGRDDSPMATCCVTQAGARIESTRAEYRVCLGRAGAALCALVLLSGAVAISHWSQADSPPVVQRVLDATDGMSKAGLAKLADSIRQQTPRVDAATQADLARAIQLRDRAQLEAVLQALAMKGLTLEQVVSPATAKQLHLAKPERKMAATPTQGREEPTAGRVNVFTPTADATGTRQNKTPLPAPAAGPTTTWSQTRQQAAAQPSAIPPRYTTLIQTMYSR
jgi:hypothetical protein